MSRIREIVIDCRHPAALARFWAGVLEGYAVRPYDGAEIARLAGLGLTPESDPTVMVDGPGPILCFQQVTAVSPGRSRIHLDIIGGPRSAEVARIIALGGSVRDIDADHTVMLDPEGAAFCVQDTR